MPGDIGSLEHAREGEAGKDDRLPAPAARSAGQKPSSRHLYIVHNADTPGPPPHMQQQPPAQRGSRSQGMIDRSVQGQIGRMLREVFADVAEDPVPDRFVKLLEALEAKEKQP
jgi:Anti-sigma factor NepR